MSSGSKRDAQEAFGEAAADALLAEQRQKKQKSSSRKSKQEHRRRESSKHIVDNHEAQKTNSSISTGPDASFEDSGTKLSHSTTQEEDDAQNVEDLTERKSNTSSRRDGRWRKRSQESRSVPTADEIKFSKDGVDRQKSAQKKHSKSSSGNQRLEAQVSAVTSQEAVVPIEHLSTARESLPLPDSSPAPQNERLRSDTNGTEPGQPKASRRNKKVQKEERKTEAETIEPVPLNKRISSRDISTSQNEASLNDTRADVSDQITPSKWKKRGQKEQQNRASLDDANGEETSQVVSSRREKRDQKLQQKNEAHFTKPLVVEKHKEQRKSKSHKGNRDQQQLIRQSRSNKLDDSGWTLSPATGGTFIDHDPVLTPDEQTLILATDRDVLIYSTKTSLLVRKLNIAGKSTIVTYSLDPLDGAFLYIGLEDGNIYKYDWTSGHRSWHFKLQGHLKSLTPTSSGSDGDNFLVVHSAEGTGHSLSSLSLNKKGEETGRNRMISNESLDGTVKFSADMGIAIICTTDTAFIGRFVQQANGEGDQLHWNQISMPGSMICFDAQILPPPSSKSKKGVKLAVVNIAVGLSSGEIHLYSDVLNQGAGLVEKQSLSINTRRLQWHRTAPLSVKFSPDSNYLVSGGDETVLVIWQLDTNQKQVLPHLTTPILNLAISRQGSAYALRLADNSVMVLSTADLQPFANVNGLALQPLSDNPHNPAVLHPNHSERLLLAHSLKAIKPEGSKKYKSSTMLQTYDMGSQIQVGSQALARNLVSIVNAGPDGQLLQEPDVTHLDISYDGQWLASVDQWSPNKGDLDEMYLSRGDNLDRRRNQECYLRLWASTCVKQGNSSMNEQWEPNTRFDEAIVESEWLNGGSKILAMAFSPTRHQLAVADSNHRAKVYSPKARMRSGLPIKDEGGNQLFTWTCDHEIPIEATEGTKTAHYAVLAFSEDGSVLAACWTSNATRTPRLHLIDPKLGAEATSFPGLITSDQPMLGFYHQHLVCLSSKLCIFDTVKGQRSFEFDLFTADGQMRPKMAIDVRHGTLALSIDSTQQPSRLLIFDIQSGIPKVVYDGKMTAGIAVLLADKADGGFVIIHQDAKIARLSAPGQRREVSSSTDVVESRVVTNGLEHIFGGGQKQIKDVAEPVRNDLMEAGPRQRTLEDVFRFNTTAQAPSAQDLFTQVAQAVAGRLE